jgi:hypothetical protein
LIRWSSSCSSRRRSLRIRGDRPVIKMAPARGSAPRPSKVFSFQIARRSSGYPSGVPIEAGKGGNVCPIVNRTLTIVEPASPASGPFLGTCSVAESRIHRSRGIVETNREKVAAPAISSQSSGAVSSAGRDRALTAHVDVSATPRRMAHWNDGPSVLPPGWVRFHFRCQRADKIDFIRLSDFRRTSCHGCSFLRSSPWHPH